MMTKRSLAILAVAAIPFTLGVLLFSGITLRLDFLDSRLESLAGNLLNRTVSIRGPVRLKASLNPSLHLGGITIGNPPDWPDSDGHFLVVEEGEAQLSLVKLLQGNFRIMNLAFAGVDLNLVTRADHSSNYLFTSPKTSTQKPARQHELTSLDRLSLRNLRVSYKDAFSSKHYTLEIDEAHGAGKPDQPLHFSLAGTFSGEPVSLTLTGGTLQDLLAGSKSWLFSEGRLNLAGAALDLSGSLNLSTLEKAGYLTLALSGRSLDAIGTLFDVGLPDIGDFSISTGISIAPGMLQFTGLQARALQSELTGDLLLSLPGERPALAGNLHLEIPDPGALASLSESGAEQSPADKPVNPEPGGLTWDLLQLADTDIRLEVVDITAGKLQIKDGAGVISVVDGDLVMPLSLSVMDLELAAQIDITTSEPVPAFGVQISSPGADLDPLFATFSEESALHGQLGNLSIAAGTSGNQPAELLEHLDISVLLGPSKLQKGDEVLFSNETLSLERIHDRLFSIYGSGELLGSPLHIDSRFDANAQPGPAFSIELQACETDLLFSGGRIDSQGDNSTFMLQLEGQKLCGLLTPVERFLGETSGFSFHGSGSLETELLKLDVKRLRLGQVELNGRAELKPGDDGNPRFSGEIYTERVDLVEILSRDKNDSEAAGDAASQPEPHLDKDSTANQAFTEYLAFLNNFLAMKVLPVKRLLGADVELAINIGQLHTGKVDISDVQFTIITKEGKLKHAPFQARIGGSTFTGSATIDATAAPPLAYLSLATEDFILAELLKDFAIEKVADITASAVNLKISLKGRTIKEMLLQAGYFFELENGRIALPREPLIPLVVTFKKIDYVDDSGQPATVSLIGDINAQPLSVEITTDGIFAKGTDKPVTVSLQAGLSDTRLEVDGQINRQVNTEKAVESFHLSTTLSGSRMDSLNELFGLNMPPLGPYQVEGTIGAGGGDQAIHLYDMGLQVGASIFNGELSMQFSPNQNEDSGFHTNLQTRLKARTIQLNDFQFGDWSALYNETAAVINPSDENPLIGGEHPPGENKSLNLVSKELAEQISGSIDIEVQEVLSGDDQLGSGTLSARLENGRYRLDSLELNVPGGEIDIKGELQPEADSISTQLSMKINRFDYGIMARRTNPESSLKGYMNLLLDLDAQADTPLQLKEHLNGRFKFGIVPEEHRAGALDLWASNILTAALPVLLKGSSSVVNCLAGDFILEDGLMRPELFMMDTSKMRVQGKGQIDFKTDAIDFFMKPTPKSASFFSLATPITVSGTILDPDIGVTAGGVVATVFRQVTSVVTVPFQWLFSESMETDGARVCAEAMQWAAQADRQE